METSDSSRLGRRGREMIVQHSCPHQAMFTGTGSRVMLSQTHIQVPGSALSAFPPLLSAVRSPCRESWNSGHSRRLCFSKGAPLANSRGCVLPRTLPCKKANQMCGGGLSSTEMEQRANKRHEGVTTDHHSEEPPRSKGRGNIMWPLPF